MATRGAHDGWHVTYLERAANDQELRAFVAAEITRAGVDCSALRAENEKLQRTVRAQALRLSELERDRHKKAPRTRR